MSETIKKQGEGCWQKLLIGTILSLFAGGSILNYFDFFGFSLCNSPKTVVGYVKEEGTRLPLINALVEITSDSVGRTARTDEQGRFEFKGIAPIDYVEIRITISGRDDLFKRQIDFCRTKALVELQAFLIERPESRQASNQHTRKDTPITMPSPAQTTAADATCCNETNRIDKVGDLTSELTCCRKAADNMILCNLSLKSDINGVFQVCANDGWTAKIVDDSGNIYPATSIVWQGEEKKRCIEIDYYQKTEVSLDLKFRNAIVIGKVVRLEVPTTYGTLIFD